MKPYGVYGRISKRKKGDGQGAYVKIADQQSQGADYVREKVDPRATFVYYEDNLSAWDPDVWRDGYEAMMSDLAGGKLAGTVAWIGDRFTRQPLQMERHFDLARRTGAELYTVQHGHVASKAMLRIQMAMAAEESDVKSRRLIEHHRRLAEAGKVSGGGRPFGYDYAEDGSGYVLNPLEAPVVEELAARIIAGVPLRKLAAWLNGPDGVPTVTGRGEWLGANVGKMIRRRLYAGKRTYAGVEYDAEWPAILDETTHANVLHVLDDPERVNHAGNARVYVLSNLMLCDVCETPLKGVHRGHGNRTISRAYACRTGRHCYRASDQVDAAVDGLIVERLSRMDAAGAIVDDAAADHAIRLERELAELERHLDELTEQNLDGSLSDAQLARSTKAAEKRDATIRRDLTAARVEAGQSVRVLAGLTGPDPETVWADVELERKRAVIAYLCERVALKGAGGRERRPFSPRDDIDVSWRIR